MTEQMWNWLGENSSAIGVLTGVLTLVVWVLYFQLLYLGFRQTQRSNLLISIAGGPQIDAQCIIANMSRQPIYIEAVAVSVKGEAGASVHSLSDLQLDGSDGDLRSRAMQGPLASGEMIVLGSYRNLVKRTGASAEGKELRFTLTAIAIYAGEDRSVAAERDFVLRGDQLFSTSARARQLRSRRDRARLDLLIQDSLVIDQGGGR